MPLEAFQLEVNIGAETMTILHDLEALDPKLSFESYKKSRENSISKLQAIISICDQKIEMIQTR